MKFYKIEKLETKDIIEIKPEGLDLLLFTKILKDVAKDKNFKNMEQLKDFFVSKEFDFKKNEATIKVSSIKNTSYAFLEKNKIFELEHKKNKSIIFGVFCNEKLILSEYKENIEKVIKDSLKKVSMLSTKEQKVWNWLENGETGMSSLVLCYHLFPNLNHEKLIKTKEENYLPTPYDNSDMNRCIKFLDKIKENQNSNYEIIKDLKINDKWDNLIKNWNDIENEIKSNHLEESQNLIDLSIGRDRKKPRL